MENSLLILRAIADDARLKIVKLLLEHNYCVGALARHLKLTESAISQHLKILREAGLIIGEKRGYFMHYDVNRNELLALAAKFKELAIIQREICKPEQEGCEQSKQDKCHVHNTAKECADKVKFFCHGSEEDENREKYGQYSDLNLCHRKD